MELVDITLQNEGLLTSKVRFFKGDAKKKTSNFIIVCDQSGASEQRVTATFNKEISRIKTNDVQSQGKELHFFVRDFLIKHSVGLNDNHHDFYMMKLPCSKSFFKDIDNCFTIKKEGEFVVTVPDNKDVLEFGDGNKLLSVPLDGKVIWTDDARLEVPVIGDEDNDQIDFYVDFGSKEIHVILKLNMAKPVPPARPGSIEGTYDGVTVTSSADGAENG